MVKVPAFIPKLLLADCPLADLLSNIRLGLLIRNKDRHVEAAFVPDPDEFIQVDGLILKGLSYRASHGGASR
jgi:hypothetical protein